MDLLIDQPKEIYEIKKKYIILNPIKTTKIDISQSRLYPNIYINRKFSSTLIYK